MWAPRRLGKLNLWAGLLKHARKPGVQFSLFPRCVSQVFREPSVDTKALVASGPDTILVSFRGTASWANIVKDLQARAQNSTSDGDTSLLNCFTHPARCQERTEGSIQVAIDVQACRVLLSQVNADSECFRRAGMAGAALAGGH